MSMKLKKKVKELTGDDASQSAKIAALETAIGDDDTPASIKCRFYALEHPANGDS